LAEVNDLDDASVSAILALEPSYQDFETAAAWAAGLANTIRENEQSHLSLKGQRILEILTSEEEWPDEAGPQS
jgi:hypothetical protein